MYPYGNVGRQRVNCRVSAAAAADGLVINGAIVGERASAPENTHARASRVLSARVNHKHIRPIHRRIRYIIPVLICAVGRRPTLGLSTDRLSGAAGVEGGRRRKH